MCQSEVDRFFQKRRLGDDTNDTTLQLSHIASDMGGQYFGHVRRKQNPLVVRLFFEDLESRLKIRGFDVGDHASGQSRLELALQLRNISRKLGPGEYDPLIHTAEGIESVS